MKVKKTNVLTKDEESEIVSLENRVLKNDNLNYRAFLSNEINFDKSLPCFYMYYEGDELIAFLTTFMPSSSEAEITAFTHPKYRKKGYFNSLLECAKETLAKAEINKVLFVVEPKSTSALEVMKAKKCTEIDRSEYKMSYLISEGELVHSECNLEFVKVDNNNKDIFEMIDEDAFPEEEPNEEFTNSIISSQNREAYIGYKDGEPVGCFNINYEEEDAFLYGIAVISKYRGQGFGKNIVKFALDKGLQKFDKVVLEVDSENPIAFNLYKKCGFTIDFQEDYYIYEF